ncbi:hypothetical protein EXN66_Car001270 [Channa argus]|uniref:Uncharacterized protein n=1 Tax=Channa argus TaxID=215402 RepID=A0A6G1R059_CHAAH|nr:hypothetical protein EXN66_Car001270 [Channa argus]
MCKSKDSENQEENKTEGQNFTCNLRALRRHCIKNRHDSLLDITAWAQEHFLKSLSVNTGRCVIHKCKLKLYHAKKKPYVNTFQKCTVFSY